MTLTGHYERSLDEKRRLALPKRLREDFAADDLASFFLAPGMDGSICLYDATEFGHYASRLNAAAATDPRHRHFVRMFYAQAERVELDKQGRIRIPDRLADFAQLDRDVMLVGVMDHAEIWDRQRWKEFLQTYSEEFDSLASQILGGEIPGMAPPTEN